MRHEGEETEGDGAWGKMIAIIRGQFDLLEDAARGDERMLKHARTVRHTVQDAVYNLKRALERGR